MIDHTEDEEEILGGAIAEPSAATKDAALDVQVAFVAFHKNAFTKHFLSHLNAEVDRLHQSATEAHSTMTETTLRSLLSRTSALKSIIKYANTPPVQS